MLQYGWLVQIDIHLIYFLERLWLLIVEEGEKTKKSEGSQLTPHPRIFPSFASVIFKLKSRGFM